MSWELSKTRKDEYDAMLNSARDLELNIGSNQFRLHKLLCMRDGMDGTIKEWWESLIKEMCLPEKRDYVILNNGIINDVTPEPIKAADTVVPSV